VIKDLGPAFEKYNEEQFVTVKLPGSSQLVIISSHSSLGDGRYYDVETSSSFAFDHATQACIPQQPMKLVRCGHTITKRCRKQAQSRAIDPKAHRQTLCKSHASILQNCCIHCLYKRQKLDAEEPGPVRQGTLPPCRLRCLPDRRGFQGGSHHCGQQVQPQQLLVGIPCPFQQAELPPDQAAGTDDGDRSIFSIIRRAPSRALSRSMCTTTRTETFGFSPISPCLRRCHLAAGATLSRKSQLGRRSTKRS
jgi:hypothetical protein